jgi:drug/metabolite transporter (DMT)-like permease
MAVLFALLAAAAYGVGDFAGGVATRRAPVMSVLLVTFPFGTLVVCAAAPFFGGDLPQRTVVLSALGGVIGLVGVGCLYAALAVAPMNIISPITGVLSAAVPVAAGVLFGERPSAIAWTGITLGLLAVVLVSRQPENHPHGPIGAKPLLLAAAAGFGFGGFFVCLARASHTSGMWPVATARLAATIVVVAVALASRRMARVPRTALPLALGAGALDAAANIAFLIAARNGLLSISSVITALYPAGTVLLAMVILKERMVRVQQVGLVIAAASVVLVTR